MAGGHKLDLCERAYRRQNETSDGKRMRVKHPQLLNTVNEHQAGFLDFGLDAM